MGCLFWIHWQVRARGPPNFTGDCQCFWLTLQNLAVRLCCWEHHTLDSYDMEKSSWYAPGHFILLTNFRGAVRCYSHYQKRKESQILHRYDPCELQQWTDLTRHGHWCNSGRNVTGATNHFFVFVAPTACYTSWNPYLAVLLWPITCG